MSSATPEMPPSCDLPHPARIVERIQESRNVFTLRLQLLDTDEPFVFAPGQFNMLYLYGVGEVAISIVSDPRDSHLLDHTIREVGRVTRALGDLVEGDVIGLRGPFGNGWPLQEAQGRDVLIVTGGLGCAPTVSLIRRVIRDRDRYGRLAILQGVKHSEDLIWREQYEEWESLDGVSVHLAADVANASWRWHQGLVTALFDRVEIDPARHVAMMCGPEPMMAASARELVARGVGEDRIWLSMERNMQCGTGHCGHCQIGEVFVCRDGPVLPYARLKPLLGVKGF